MKQFAVIGLSGYIAPRHIKAIQGTNNTLLAATDPHDNVGFLDSYYPEASFFTEFERFDRYMDKLRNNNIGPDYVSVCSPNYLHDAHIKSALRWGTDAICEKPLVLNPWNLDTLERLEKETGKRVWNILQLRLHPSIIALKKKIEQSPADTMHDVDLSYITSRGLWYYASWKGDVSKSGGIATNIGIHFFDMLIWIFGAAKKNTVQLHNHDRAAGYLELEKANVRWFLSINSDTLPSEIKAKNQSTFRSIKVDGEEVEFSNGFTNLHTESYKQIIAGNGFGIEEARTSIEIVHDIRNKEVKGLKGEYHPLAKLSQSKHPFGL
jgi:UDP-N-acetyl-2-amino-2-deoxyglucuronate dehydrogenase